MSIRNKLLHSALRYAKRGWPVFPLHNPTAVGCSCGKSKCDRIGKHPRTPNGFKDATTDPRQITKWWTRWPEANIGVPTGERSGFWVLDVDRRHRGLESLANLEKECGPLPDGPRARTGGGGLHIYFTYPGRHVKCKTGILPGIDVKAEGGYVVMPPSLHGSGNKYLWLRGKRPSEIPLPEMPEWLLRVLSNKDGSRKERGADSVRVEENQAIPEGKRNSTLASLAGSMRQKGMTQEEIEAALLKVNERRCEPPLDEREVSAIAHSIGRYEPGSPNEQQHSDSLPISEILSHAGFDELDDGADIDKVEEVLRALATQLKGVNELRRQAVIQAATSALKQIGIRAPVNLVKAALQSTRTDHDSQQGQMVIFENVEPWADPVDGNQLVRDIRGTFRDHAKLPNGGATLLAFWVLHAYVFDIADISPFLGITSPEKRCGKTVVLSILKALVRRPLATANITPAAVFRTIEKYCPTLLIDEADTFVLENNELRGVLNSGHTKASAFVIRTVGDDHEPRIFATWCPRVFALIGDLPATLEDRSIRLRMQRKTAKENVKRFRVQKIAKKLEIIRRKAARWALDNLEALRDAEPDVPEELNDRAQDNWRPLLAIADAIGGCWPKRARKVSLMLSAPEAAEENSNSIKLLADIRNIFQKKGADKLHTETILNHLHRMEERPWAELKMGKPITATQLARLLKKYDIGPREVWRHGRNLRGYELADFQNLFRRYLPPSDPLGPLGTNNHGAKERVGRR